MMVAKPTRMAKIALVHFVASTTKHVLSTLALLARPWNSPRVLLAEAGCLPLPLTGLRYPPDAGAAHPLRAPLEVIEPWLVSAGPEQERMDRPGAGVFFCPSPKCASVGS